MITLSFFSTIRDAPVQRICSEMIIIRDDNGEYYYYYYYSSSSSYHHLRKVLYVVMIDDYDKENRMNNGQVEYLPIL